MRYFSLAFSLARLNHLISFRNRSPKHLKKINFYILYSCFFTATATAGNIHINARTCCKHTRLYIVRIRFYFRPFSWCQNVKWLWIRKIFALVHFDLHSHNIWWPKCATILSYRWWRWPFFSRRIICTSETRYELDSQVFRHRRRQHFLQEEAFEQFFFFLYCSCGGHSSYFNEPFFECLVCRVLLVPVVVAEQKCKYGLSAYDSHFMHTKNMWEKISQVSPLQSVFRFRLHRIWRRAAKPSNHLFLAALPGG